MKNAFFALLWLCAGSMAWFATEPYQERAICARVFDNTNQPIQGATVRILNDSLEAVAKQHTDHAGLFCAQVKPGTYTVEISHPGFARLRIVQVPVGAKDKTDLARITLERAEEGLEQAVVVSYRPPLFQQEDEAAGSREGGILRPARSDPGRERMADAPKTMGAPISAEHRRKSLPLSMAIGEGASDAAPSSAAPAAKPAAPSESSPRRERPVLVNVRAGQLTAGEWNDLHNWNNHWTDLLRDGEIDGHQKTYQFYPKYRYAVLLHNEAGMPLTDVPVRLLDRHGAVLWEARTSNTGQAELWVGLFDGKTPEGTLKVVADVDGKTHALGTPKPYESGLNLYKIKRECRHAKTVDIVWTVDATGSMGDEMDYLKAELLDVIGRVQERFPDLDVRMGSVFYRDVGDEYLVKSSALNRDVAKTVDYIRRQKADGGGDYPEAAHSALEETLRQPWSREAVARICFLVLDASPHQRPEVIQSIQRSIQEAARRGIRIVPIGCSGIRKDTEFLMKFFGLATNGSYVFLTDHSGIGGKHLEPTADVYKVELLNDLIARIIGEYISTPNCDDGKVPVAFQTKPDPQSDTQQVPPALYYPNPVRDHFTLELPFDASKVVLYDAGGKASQDLGALPAGTHTVALKNLPAGTYTLRIWHGGALQSGKVLLVRS